MFKKHQVVWKFCSAVYNVPQFRLFKKHQVVWKFSYCHKFSALQAVLLFKKHQVVWKLFLSQAHSPTSISFCLKSTRQYGREKLGYITKELSGFKKHQVVWKLGRSQTDNNRPVGNCLKSTRQYGSPSLYSQAVLGTVSILFKKHQVVWKSSGRLLFSHFPLFCLKSTRQYGRKLVPVPYPALGSMEAASSISVIIIPFSLKSTRQYGRRSSIFPSSLIIHSLKSTRQYGSSYCRRCATLHLSFKKHQVVWK